MQNPKEINKILQNHEKRIAALESIINKPKSTKKLKEKKALTDHILDLREKSFFSTAKTAEETLERLQKTYPCEVDRVAMALLRLSNKKQLRKATKMIDEKKYKAYVW